MKHVHVPLAAVVTGNTQKCSNCMTYASYCFHCFAYSMFMYLLEEGQETDRESS